MDKRILADAYFQSIVTAYLAGKKEEAEFQRKEMGHFFPKDPQYRALAKAEQVSIAPNAHIYFLGIGINEYMPPFPNLGGCLKDVENMQALIKDAWGGRNDLHSSILTNAQATRTSAVRELEKIISSAREDDFILFYFSGLAGQGLVAKMLGLPQFSDYCFAMSDTRKPTDGALPESAFWGKDLESIFKQSRTPNNFVIVDSNTDEGFIKRVEQQGNFTIIFGCSPGESALEANGQGVFTQYFCETIREEWHQPTEGFDLFGKVKTKIREKYPQQTPLMVGDITPLFFPIQTLEMEKLVGMVYGSTRSLTEKDFYILQGLYQRGQSSFWPILSVMGQYLLEKGEKERAAHFFEEYWQVSYRGLQKSSSELKESCIIEKKSSICNNTKSTTQKNWLQWLMR